MPSNVTTRKQWRCFHCNLVLKSKRAARLHFGDWAEPGDASPTPACRIDIKEFRTLERDALEMQERLNEYCDEDTSLHRRIRELESAMAAACRRAEEDGYARGMLDANRMNQQ